ncbi:hypothetical protein SUDANB95_08001 (plasmid) [Actinosynnema sp. ALI-1.44]
MTATEFSSWSEVPWYLMTRTQLKELDLPRDPAGQPVAATVISYHKRNKGEAVPLFDARTCPPTAASVAQLTAAATRARNGHVCQDCGAHSERALLERHTTGPRGEPGTVLRLCHACWSIARIRAKQAEAAQHRRRLAEWAREVLSREGLAVLWSEEVVPPAAPSGRARPVTAVRLGACDIDARPLLDLTVRLVGPRAKWVPEGAISAEEAAPAILRALAGRPVLMSDASVRQRLQTLAHHEAWADAGAGGRKVDGEWVPYTYEERVRMSELRHLVEFVDNRVELWRGQVNPASGNIGPALPAGSAQRLLLLLRRMAGSAPE